MTDKSKHIKRAVELKQQLDILRPLNAEDELRVMQKFRLDWNYHSNNLEGNSLTYGETKALILFGITAQGKPLKDHFEITGHNEAVKWIIELVKEDRPMTERFIRELHQLILKDSYEVNAITAEGQPTTKKVNVGAYKTTPNHVKTVTGEIFRFATPEETPALMQELVTWYKIEAAKEGVNPILLAAKFHYRYIRIHPFDDGNGRTARILMNFILMRFGYPPVIIKTEDKENYFAALRQADAGLVENFIDYIAQNLQQSLALMIAGAKGESIEEPDDFDKEVALLEQELKSLGSPAEITKSRSRIVELYNVSIAPLARHLLDRGKLFSKFYAETSFEIFVDGLNASKSQSSNIEDIVFFNRKMIHINTNTVTITYIYKYFRQLEFMEFHHSSSIQFTLNITSYTVATDDKKVSFEKFYGQQLNENKINQLVNAELKRHKEVIEKQMEQFKKNNSK